MDERKEREPVAWWQPGSSSFGPKVSPSAGQSSGGLGRIFVERKKGLAPPSNCNLGLKTRKLQWEIERERREKYRAYTAITPKLKTHTHKKRGESDFTANIKCARHKPGRRWKNGEKNGEKKKEIRGRWRRSKRGLVLRWQPMMMMTAMKEQGNLVKNKKFFFFVNNNSWHRKFGDVKIQLLKKKNKRTNSVFVSS